MLLFFVLGRDSLEQASEQAARLGEQLLAAETGSFTTPSSPGDADSSLMSVPHSSARRSHAHRGFFLRTFSPPLLLEHQRKYLAKLAVSFFSGFVSVELTSPLSCLTGAATRTS